MIIYDKPSLELPLRTQNFPFWVWVVQWEWVEGKTVSVSLEIWLKDGLSIRISGSDQPLKNTILPSFSKEYEIN